MPETSGNEIASALTARSNKKPLRLGFCWLLRIRMHFGILHSGRLNSRHLEDVLGRSVTNLLGPTFVTIDCLCSNCGVRDQRHLLSGEAGVPPAISKWLSSGATVTNRSHRNTLGSTVESPGLDRKAYDHRFYWRTGVWLTPTKKYEWKNNVFNLQAKNRKAQVCA